MDSYEELRFAGSAADSLTKCPGKNVLHFSDGTLDLDELDASPIVTNQTPVDPQKLSWAPWVWYYTMFAGSKALEVCDYLGEFFASAFGITTPKYQYEISEYYRMQKEEQESKERDIEQSQSNFVLGGRQLNENDTMGQHQMPMENIQLQYTNTVHVEKC